MSADEDPPRAPREPLAYAIPRFAVSRPVTILMILATILVVGLIALDRIPLALFPEGYESNQLYISARYPNASPRDVEEKVTRKIEDILGTVPNIKRLTSYSSNGSSSVRVELQTGTSLRETYALITDRMDRVKPLLPTDVDRIDVRRYAQTDAPMMNIIASVPPTIDDAAYRLENFVKPALQRIEGVGNVDIYGTSIREVQIELIDDRLRSHRIDVGTMLGTLRNQNFAISGGYVIDGGRKIYVRSMGRFNTLEDIAAIIVDNERRLRLSDVALVRFRPPRREYVYRVDGQPAIGIQVTRDSTGNIERISREVRATLLELQKLPQLKGVNFNIFFDQGVQVKQSIDNLAESGLWGGIFAALIIYLFLRAPRMTAILTLSIPLSLLCTIVVLFFTGWSLNMATMMGLLLAVGMVVDNSIVIVENIYRLRQEGADATQASIVGAGEVGLAVVMSTFTSIVVFLPLILMKGGGDFSFWMLRLGLPVIASLLASLLIALIFVPLAAQRLTRGTQHPELRAVVWVRERYVASLHWVLNHRIESLLVVVAAMWTLPFAQSKIRMPTGGMGGGTGETTLYLYFNLPTGGTLERADAFFTQVEAFLTANATRYNFDRMETRFAYNNGRIQIRLRDDTSKQWFISAWDSFVRTDVARRVQGLFNIQPTPAPMDRSDIEADFREKFKMPAGITQLGRAMGGGIIDPGMSMNLYGEDTGTLLQIADEAVRRLRGIPGLLAVDIDTERGGQELQVQIDRDRSRRLGIDPRAVSSGIGYTMRGQEVGRFPGADGRDLRIFAQLGEADRTGLDDVRGMTFRTETGVEVPLETLADLRVSRTLGQIRREGRQTMLQITAKAPRADSRRLFEAVDKAMADFEMPRGYRWDKGREYREAGEQEKAMMFAGGLAITFVFLLMGLLFESFVLPLAVITAVPFAYLGVVWTLYLTETPLDMMARIGIVILVGVVVNNAIVLVDMANRLRAQGKTRYDALIEAGRHRFRPIMMTTLTTVCGLIPMALGTSRVVGMAYAPLGRTMIGGLLAATLLTLVIVPLFYALLDDLREFMGRVWTSIFTRSTPATVASGAAAGIGRANRAE